VTPLAPAAPQEPVKPPNPNAMNIVFVGSECAPWSKTGANQSPSNDWRMLCYYINVWLLAVRVHLAAALCCAVLRTLPQGDGGC
jgi:hypothetical protein